jgi:uncharacterized protein YcbK (DUF882 family)
VPKDTARKVKFSFGSSASKRVGFAACIFFLGSQSLQSVIANGDTRTISFHHLHTGEDLTITYKRDGRYDEAALEKINYHLRDWRRDEPVKMDPHLIDLLWDVNREFEGKEPIQIVCGYRSPGTNAMLRARSRGVAQFSQHMLGKAIDFYIPGVGLSQLRDVGLRMQRGGVGFYPTSGSPFVHLDTGNVRHWPKVSRELLSRIFPDGKTVHIPADGRPMPGYELAFAEIKARGGETSSFAVASRGDANDENVGTNTEGGRIKKFFANLFANKKNIEEDEETNITTVRSRPAVVVSAEPAGAMPQPAQIASANVSPSMQRGPQMQWVTGPSAASTATSGQNSATPLPRARPANTDVASLPAGSRQVDAIGNLVLPAAITGSGVVPENHALAYAENDNVIARANTAMPQATSQSVRAVNPMANFAPTASASDPNICADAALAPVTLLNARTILFSSELYQPDYSSALTLIEPSQLALKAQFVVNTAEQLAMSRFASRTN